MPKPKIHPAARLWPGLPHLWTRGSWVGLAVAVGFTALANILLLSFGVFHQWLEAQTEWIGLGVLAVVWVFAWWQTRDWRRASSTDEDLSGGDQPQDDADDERDQVFMEAQRLYLQNDWVRTEQLLLKLLKQDARDIESRLMLATLWRHQGRNAEALRQLDKLERLEAASHWQYEIGALRQALTPQEKEEIITEDIQRPQAA